MVVDPFTVALDVRDIGYTGNWLDRADAVRNNPELILQLQNSVGARFLTVQDGRPVLNVGSGRPKLLWLDAADIPAHSNAIFLGLQGEIPHFAVSIPAGVALPGKALDARAAAMQMAAADSAIIAQARSLLLWHERHQHCAVCGAHTEMKKAGYQRQCVNPDCAAEHFPRTDPVAIMLIIDKDRCLLGRQPQFPPRFFSALAGFIEPGETLEEAVARETYEEAGIRCGRVRYVASQPWPFPSSLMIGCFAEAISFDITLDKTELEEAQWFSREDCLAGFAGSGSFMVPPPMAIAHHLLKAWAELE
jgi:NAD+ diphosphatase